MPKQRQLPRVLKRIDASKSRRDIQRHMTCVQRDKENNLTPTSDTSDNDPLLTFMKIEVKEEELDPSQQLDFSQEIDIPFKIEQFENLECTSIKQEEVPNSDDEILTGGSNTDLNILIEWALNLQYDHSRKCTGRLYPCKEILDNFRCKIVVLYCTVCKKRMLHTLKDWANA